MSAAQAQSAISRLQPIDAPQSTISVAKMLGDLVSGHRFTQVLFATADPVSQPLPPSLHIFKAGDPLPNFAIGSFAVGGAQFGSGALRARLTVANFSSQPQNLEVAISAEGKTSGQGAGSRWARARSAAWSFPPWRRPPNIGPI